MSRTSHQAETWQGEFGRLYTDRNLFSTGELDTLYRTRYGIGRFELNERFMAHVDHDIEILEVGCNLGNQLLVLQESGFHNISGVELQSYALGIAKERLYNAHLTQGTALALPFRDDSFDLVFTAGVLIHLPPSVLAIALREIYRCSRRYIWGLEYYAEECTPIEYRGQSDLLWKTDYAKLYLERFPELVSIDQMTLAYVDGDEVDQVFMLAKVD